jgi:hypothetical protein
MGVASVTATAPRLHSGISTTPDRMPVKTAYARRSRPALTAATETARPSGMF